MIALVTASLALLLYTYAGYPILIAALARLFPQRVDRDPTFEPKVSVLIPIFNAKSFVEAKLESLLEQDYPKDRLEILVYSDGSTDGGDEIVRAYAERHEGRVRLLRGDRRTGKPNALNVF